MTRAELVRTRDRIDAAIEIVRSALAAAQRTRLEMLIDAPDLGAMILAARDGGELVDLKRAALAALEDARRDVEAVILGTPVLRIAAANE